MLDGIDDVESCLHRGDEAGHTTGKQQEVRAGARMWVSLFCAVPRATT